MKISLDWLREFVNLPTKLDVQNLAETLTLKTAEVEDVMSESEAYDKIVVGQIREIKSHPNADKLKICITSVGKDDLQIICGGTNLRKGMYLAVAKIGALVNWHGEGKMVEMERTNIRGVESEGMICAGSEIGLEQASAGERDILDLSALKPTAGTSLAQLLEKDDTVLEFDNKSLTHRPDLWGHYGIAREIAAITNNKFKELKTNPPIPGTGKSIKVKVENPELCPRYCGLIIENITVEDSPEWLAKRLKTVGHGTHNNIVDVTNYVMAELGQPLHAFDANEIKNTIIVRTAKEKEKLHTLDDKEKILSKEMLVIADEEKVLAIAGVMGGKHSGINQKTKTIILESANFNAGSVRRTSVKLGLRTDAVQRFEKSIDPHLAELAIKRAAELILKICPTAKIAGPITDIKNFSPKDQKIDLSISKTVSKIGATITSKQIQEILTSLHFEITPTKDKDILKITVPSFRSGKDVNIEDDLIEEVARIYGYENLVPTLPALPTKIPKENSERSKKHQAREVLSYGLGFDEVYNYSFYGKAEIERCLMSEKNHLKLLNYLSSDQTHLRTSLVPNLFKNIQLNTRFFENFKLYEIGHTYKEIDEFMPLEEKQILGAIIQKGKSDHPFYEAKGTIETFFQKFGIKFTSSKDPAAPPYGHPTKSLVYLGVNGATIGKVFTAHPQVIKNHDLEKYSIAFFVIKFSEIMKLPIETKKYRQIPRFPGINIDIAVLIDKTTEIAKIQKTISESDKELITFCELFDLYEGPNIPADKKSAAFKILLQAEDRTLTDEEMATTQKKIFQNLEKIGGEIRGK